MESTRRGFLGGALGAGFLPGAAAATTDTTGDLKIGVGQPLGEEAQRLNMSQVGRGGHQWLSCRS